MRQLDTARLVLRPLHAGDSAFIIELLNDAGFLRYIGDRGVRTPAQARDYIASGPVASYDANNFGLLLVQSKQDATPLGMCGLVQRNYFPDPDLGFAFLPQYRTQGFAFEAAQAIMADAYDFLKFRRVLAIVQADNSRSLGLLNKLGFAAERIFKLTADDPELLVLSVEKKAGY